MAEASDPNRWNSVRQSCPGVTSNFHPFPTSLESTLLPLSLPPLFGSFSPGRPAFRPFLHYQNYAPKHCPHRPEGPTVRRNTFPNPLPPRFMEISIHLPRPFVLREFIHTVHHASLSLRDDQRLSQGRERQKIDEVPHQCQMFYVRLRGVLKAMVGVGLVAGFFESNGEPLAGRTMVLSCSAGPTSGCRKSWRFGPMWKMKIRVPAATKIQVPVAAKSSVRHRTAWKGQLKEFERGCSSEGVLFATAGVHYGRGWRRYSQQFTPTGPQARPTTSPLHSPKSFRPMVTHSIYHAEIHRNPSPLEGGTITPSKSDTHRSFLLADSPSPRTISTVHHHPGIST